ncbi:hypothetical protein [Novosphingobium resinovorum]|uniref:hypothetical protein n=1 Tax=Novosphingobium resinovorum TaxID=158500 RepID=UPI002ED48271|nr:hypothetical protein [Novosphingobium resinovorum]
MPQQPDLLAISIDDVQPAAGKGGPRLWVRRLVIWRGVGDPIRAVTLRPGLNIIWSPDSGTENEAMGHGGGKTSFCRLLRYCLGENSFGSHALREVVARKIPDGYVGAEVVLDGEAWVVLRPIGVDNRHYCAKGEVLEAAFGREMPHTGLGALCDAITQAFMPEAASRMPLANPVEEAWEVALAWLTRDQECRLLSALEWRSAQTESHSASRQRQLSQADRLVIVRLLVNALSAGEMEASRLAEECSVKIEQTRRQRRRLQHLVEDMQEDLSQKFGASDAQADFWKAQAAEAVVQAEAAADPQLYERLTKAREDKDGAERALTQLGNQLAGLNADLATKTELRKTIDNNSAKAHTHVYDAQNPVCKTCGTRMDQKALDFVREREQERDDLIGKIAEIAGDIGALESNISAVKYQIAAAQQAAKPLAEAVIALERALVDQSRRLSAAKGDITMSTRYATHLGELKTSTNTIEQLVQLQSTHLNAASEHRVAALQNVDRLSLLFDAVLKFLIPETANGKIDLEQNELNLRFQMGGDRSTAAVDSLKIVAFDLATLLLTIEGRTQLPAFLIHDSPREADLGLSIYNRLFTMSQKLEEIGGTPLFQYIVTTTTAPPEAFQKEPWQRLELHGAPADKRVFGMDF